MRNLTILLYFFVLTGCSSLSLNSASELSVTGQEIAGAAKNGIFSGRDVLNNALDAEAMAHGEFSENIRPCGNSDFRYTSYETTLCKMESIDREMVSRSVVFDDLSELYAALGSLTNYDASTEVEEGVVQLSGSVNDYGKIFSLDIAQPSESNVGIVSGISGLLTKEKQKQSIKSSSQRIRLILENLIEVMENELVKEQINGFHIFLVNKHQSAVEEFISKGIYDVGAVFESFGESAGLTVKNAKTNPVFNDEKILLGVKELIKQRFRRQREALSRNYDNSIKGLKLLVSEHKKLEKGEEMNLKRRTQILNDLNYYTGLLGN